MRYVRSHMYRCAKLKSLSLSVAGFMTGGLAATLYVHERLKAYVCVLYDYLCAPLLLPWLGEVEGTSLAMSQAKASPVPAHVPMFRVPTVLRRVPSAVPQTVVGESFGQQLLANGP